MGRQNLDELKELLDTLDTFVAKLDPDGTVLFCNKAPLRVASINAREVYGRYFPDTKWFIDSKTERAKIIDCLQKARVGISTKIETSIRDATDNIIPIIFDCQPIKSDAGQVKYICVEGKTIEEEIRHRVEMSKALQDGEARYKELVQNANSIILRRDIKGYITFFNEFAQEFFGYSRDEILGKNVVGTIIPEDEDMILEVIAKILKEYDYEVKFARDGVEAIGLYEKAWTEGHPFAGVIMDLTIPGGMGGKEAIRKLRQIDPEVKAIVSSGYSSDPVMSDFRRYGFCGVITKPFKPKELYETLREVVSN